MDTLNRTLIRHRRLARAARVGLFLVLVLAAYDDGSGSGDGIY